MSYTTMEHHIKGERVGRISELYFILCFCEWLSNSTRFCTTPQLPPILYLGSSISGP
jgi:hypothetical protein